MQRACELCRARFGLKKPLGHPLITRCMMRHPSLMTTVALYVASMY